MTNIHKYPDRGNYRHIYRDRRIDDAGPPVDGMSRRGTAERWLPLALEDVLTEKESLHLMARHLHLRNAKLNAAQGGTDSPPEYLNPTGWPT